MTCSIDALKSSSLSQFWYFYMTVRYREVKFYKIGHTGLLGVRYSEVFAISVRYSEVYCIYSYFLCKYFDIMRKFCFLVILIKLIII